jgi:surfactin synthase thioesterase subunit
MREDLRKAGASGYGSSALSDIESDVRTARVHHFDRRQVQSRRQRQLWEHQLYRDPSFRQQLLPVVKQDQRGHQGYMERQRVLPNYGDQQYK